MVVITASHFEQHGPSQLYGNIPLPAMADIRSIYQFSFLAAYSEHGKYTVVQF